MLELLKGTLLSSAVMTGRKKQKESKLEITQLLRSYVMTVKTNPVYLYNIVSGT